MAITRDMMDEDSIFSRQERVVVRSVYRAYKLSEAIKAIDELQYLSNRMGPAETGDSSVNAKEHAKVISLYLQQQLCKALLTTKVPTVTPITKEE